jgi:hypothetical protein
MTATGLYSDGTSANLTALAAWNVSDDTLAAVSNAAGTRGQVVALLPGSVQITATVMGVSGSTDLTITSATLKAIQVTPFVSSLPATFSESLVATGIYSDGTSRDITRVATWTSADTTVVSVSDAAASKGLARAAAPGMTMVSAQLSGLTGTATVTVSAAVLVTISVGPVAAFAATGDVVPFTATGMFDDGTSLDITTVVTWTSSDTQVADVSNADGSHGQATAFSAGTTTIQAQRGAITSTANLTVN